MEDGSGMLGVLKKIKEGSEKGGGGTRAPFGEAPTKKKKKRSRKKKEVEERALGKQGKKQRAPFGELQVKKRISRGRKIKGDPGKERRKTE